MYFQCVFEGNKVGEKSTEERRKAMNYVFFPLSTSIYLVYLGEFKEESKPCFL